jgi:putative heme-binding domain-containing protein
VLDLASPCSPNFKRLARQDQAARQGRKVTAGKFATANPLWRTSSGTPVHLAAALLLAALSLLLACPSSSSATEPWADERLPVRDGLTLWLDAARATGSDSLLADGPLSQWRDASGAGRHLLQSDAQAQPALLKVGESAVVRFDGVDDHLRAVNQAAELNSFTLVLVAAPRQNIGAFRGLFALNVADKFDHTSGLAVDLGPAATARFSFLNVEGRGFRGAQNLRSHQTDFGRLQTLVITSNIADKTVRLIVDGQPEGERPREDQAISLDEITAGARRFNNSFDERLLDGFGRIDMAEVLLYDRALEPSEIEAVQKYLATKYAAIKDVLPPEGDGRAEPLQAVENPPAVQMFVPGFSVRELPLDLTNINNVKYRPDGTLVALAYDGKIWLLRDTDDDGLEDKADLFWANVGGLQSPIGMDLTPPGYSHGDGVFIVGKSRCLLIVDTDGDDLADKEIDIAGGWKENAVAVDGVGIAFDPRDGSVYFGRGTFNYLDPLLRDEHGKSRYELTDETGAILRVSPDFKSREVVATGIRFSIGLRLNGRGDLFATDQEGATWVPNGNPFDELLHIQRGRHYGFPARHPVHLPNVIDEPSTFDFGPQHQCLCGFNFNDPVQPSGPIFGPAAWAGDALVAGYSRGKLFRTQLVKTSAGYVARTQHFAALNMLTVDVCVSPDGDLVAACHSGGPDWGSGPTGKGKLFKIEYVERDQPQPVVAWAAGPRELRVEFDRPVDPQSWRDVLARAKLTAGKYVRAGDRFESLTPGYIAVQHQKLTPRYDVPLRSVQLTPDGRTLVLATDPMLQAVGYALALPNEQPPESDKPAAVPQHAAIDLGFDLTGCEATWTPADGGPTWTGWLPHFDLAVSRRLTAGSAPHDALWAAMAKPGELTLRGQLDLVDMLRPAVQPGSKIDYEYPPEAVTVAFATSSPQSTIRLTPPPTAVQDSAASSPHSFTIAADAEKIVPVEVRLTTDGAETSLTVTWTTNEDDRPRPLPLRRLLVPWAVASGKNTEAIVSTPAPELEGGSWAKGYREFFGEQAACFKCHVIYGRGGGIGPNLSNLIHRDYASVLRDITHPSFAINPDYLPYSLTLNDGRVLAGVIHTAGDKVTLGDAEGKTTEFDRADIDEMQPASISTMPEGMPKQLGPERIRDLLTFLLTPPPQMSRDYVGPRPKARSLAEVNAMLAGAPEPPPPADKLRPIRILLVAGPQDHGPGEHDYPAWQRAWAELLAAADGVEIATAWEWPAAEELKNADVIVFYQRGDWNPTRAAQIDAYLERGGGLVYIHWAVDGRDSRVEKAQRIGLASGGSIAYRHGDLTLMFNRATNHPIIRNFDTLTLIDETYWKLTGSLPSDRILGSAVEEGEPQPQMWTVEPRNGRVFVSIPGHYSWTFDDPLFRVLLLRGIAWSAREPVDRLNELVWPGAELAQ